MSSRAAININIRFRQPLWWSSNYFELVLSSPESYTHTISVDGGFKSAQITFQATINEIDEWLEYGLARDVKVFGPEGSVIWEGIVNEVSAVVGTLDVKRGPLFAICNRASVVYTPYLYTATETPTTGTTTETVIAEDEESQDRYGILEDVVSGGTLMDDATDCGEGCVPDNEAEMIRDAYLAENKYPETSESINLDKSDTPKITLNCVGYGEFLKKYVYNNDEGGTIWIPDKIAAVLMADPNNVISRNMDYIDVAAPFLQLTTAYEDQNRMADAILQDLLSMGDGNDNRTFLAIFEDRIAHYTNIPTWVEYRHRITAREAIITTLANDTIVNPWMVRPWKWIFLTDFMVGRIASPEMRKDPRNMFIESVTYTMPFGLSLQGSKVGTVKQLMAKYGTKS